MRIIRLRLRPQVIQYTEKIAREFAFDDPGFVQDIFALLRLKGQGLPSKDRIQRMARAVAKKNQKMTEIGISLIISKRKAAFLKLLDLPYFYALAALPNTVDSCIRLLTKFRKLYFKARQSQCIACALRSKCEFGKQYGDNITDITYVVEPKFDSKVHEDCPVRPEIAAMNQFASSVSQMHQMVNSENPQEQAIADNAGPAKSKDVTDEFNDLETLSLPPEDGNTDDDTVDLDDQPEGFVARSGAFTKSGFYDGSHNFDHTCRVSERFLDEVTLQQMVLFELGRKFSLALSTQKKGKFKPVAEMSQDKEEVLINKESDITQVMAVQHGLPKEVFDAKLEKKTLKKNTFRKPEDKKQGLYLLIDNSGSMGSMLSGGKRGLLTRGSLAMLMSLAVTRHVRDDGGIVWVRFFGGAPGRLEMARIKSEYDPLLDYIASANFRQGSTDICAAISVAAADIKASKDELARAEILLLTDCEDYFDAKKVKKALDGYELNTLDCSGGGASGAVSKMLQDVSTKYYKANEGATDVKKLVELV